jgi:hypothetical protein
MNSERKNILINFTLFSLTIILFFLILEIFFTFYIKKWIAEYTAVNLPIFEKSEYRTWNMKPYSFWKQGFKNPIPEIKINSIWLRDDEISESKEKKRILMLWDSFVFWMWEYQHLTTSRFLEKKYLWGKFWKVINAGVIWQTVDDAFLYLKNEWIKLKPNIIVYNFFVWNDITELKRHKLEFNKKWNLIKTFDTEHFVNSENFLRKKWKSEPSSYFVFWLKNIFTDKSKEATLTWPVFFTDKNSKDENIDKYWWVFWKILKQMNNYAKKRKIKFLVNIIPMDVQVWEKYRKKYPYLPFAKEEFEAKRPQKRIINLMKKEWIKFSNPLPIFQDIEKKLKLNLYFKKDPHFNEKWAKWNANTIYLKMRNEKWL